MPSHFSSIGIGLTSTTALESLAAAVIRDRSCEIFGASHGRYFRYRSPSGAELWLQADRRRRLMGANPHFAGPARLHVRLTGHLLRPGESELDGALQGFAVLTDPTKTESGQAPLTFDVPDAARHLGLTFPRVEPVQLAAFAHELAIWPDEATYLGSPPAHRPGDGSEGESLEALPAGATRALVPIGPVTVSAAPPKAEALLTGVVLKAERLVNELTGDSFWWLLVESVGGTIDLVADPELVSAPPAPGAVAEGAVWLSGRLVGRDPGKRTWLSRILNR